MSLGDLGIFQAIKRHSCCRCIQASGSRIWVWDTSTHKSQLSLEMGESEPGESPV